MLCRANVSSVSQVRLDATTPSMLFSLTGGVSFCSGVRSARGSFGEPKVTPPPLVYTPSDPTSPLVALIDDAEDVFALIAIKILDFVYTDRRAKSGDQPE
jgi:hypothetical protein